VVPKGFFFSVLSWFHDTGSPRLSEAVGRILISFRRWPSGQQALAAVLLTDPTVEMAFLLSRGRHHVAVNTGASSST